MADLPARDDIDAVVELIGGPMARFENLPPADRIAIVGLVNQSDLIAETARVADNLAEIEKQLANCDVELTKVGDWFRCSRVYEG